MGSRLRAEIADKKSICSSKEESILSSDNTLIAAL